MKSKKYGLIASILLSSAVLMPASNANAWIAVGHWGGGCCYHPAPCYAGIGCAAVAGFALGAAVASRPPAVVYAPPIAPTVIVNNPAPVYVAPAPAPVYAAPAGPIIGSTVTLLPEGSKSMTVNGTQYYQSGSAWYRPYFGSNGVYYTVVTAP